MSQQITFGGVTITAPTVFKVALRDLDSDKTSRNANGYMMRDRIRGAMRTLHFEWGPLRADEIKTYFTSCKPRRN